MSDKNDKGNQAETSLGDSVELFNDIFSEESTNDLEDIQVRQTDAASKSSKGKAKPSAGHLSKGRTVKSSSSVKRKPNHAKKPIKKKGKQPVGPIDKGSAVKEEKVKKGKGIKKSSHRERKPGSQKGLEIPLQAKPKKRTNPLVLIMLFVVLVTVTGYLINYFGIVDFKELTSSAIGSSKPVSKNKIRLSITQKAQDERVAKTLSTPPQVIKTEKPRTKIQASPKTPQVKGGQDEKVAKKLSTPPQVIKTEKPKTKIQASPKTPHAKKEQDKRIAKTLSTPPQVIKTEKPKTKIQASPKTPHAKKEQDKTVAKTLSTPSVPPQAVKSPDKKISDMRKKTTSYPYSVYLGSFRTMKGVHRTVLKSRKYGLSPYWIKIDLGEKGQWFRVFAGYFETRKGADTFIKVKNIEGAESRHTIYANLIGTYTSAGALDRKQTNLLELGYSPYEINDKTGVLRLYVGAFYQKVRAEKQNAALASKGIQSRLVRR